MNTYDAVVVGCGGVGSATLAHLASRGLRVLGIDRFASPHNRGSSHGRTRMIRQAYFEHPSYVPLVLRAYDLWHELEQATGSQLYEETGLLEIGPPGGVVVPGVLASAKLHGLDVAQLSATEIMRRYPGFHVPEGMVGVVERRAGFLHVERCVDAYLRHAQCLGAEFHVDEAVQTWRVDGSEVVVETDRAKYRAARLVLTAGPWAGSLLADLGIPLEVRRKPQYWFAPTTADYTLAAGTPAFLYETVDDQGTPAGVFYGFPVVGPEGLKCAEHSGGALVTDPLALGQAVDEADLARVRTFLNRYLRGVTTTLVDHAPCMYTMSPDENFLVDRHPAHPQIVFAAGLSGHGFKFASVLGKALTELVVDGATSLPVDFLGIGRFQK
ncbi:MAG: N-methyl-L-tryptophan oxidase [Pirellula sp.]|nr:N-methyl-L-tryptophan oxidase [Pirellula sp.]